MLHLNRHHRESGFTLTSVMIACAIATVASLLLIQLVEIQIHGFNRINRAVERVEAGNLILKSVSNVNTCTCQMSAAVDAAQASSLYVDPNTVPMADINLTTWRGACDFSDASNIIVQTGTLVQGTQTQLKVGTVKITNIRMVQSPSRFTGTLAVAFAPPAGEPQMPPVTADFGFEIDPNAGSANARPITNCFTPTPTQTNWLQCPTGYTLVGGLGPDSFCIDSADRPANTLTNAQNDCLATIPAGYFGSLCQLTNMMVACSLGVVAPTHWLMTDGINFKPNYAPIALGSSCSSYGMIAGPVPYRCCIK